MNYTEWFVKNKLEKEHSWVQQNLLFETILGSRAYGCENDASDYDIYCIVMPRRDHLWPQNYGYIYGYDDLPSFRRLQLKGDDRTIVNGKEIEIEWISIIEFFNLAAIKGSPNLMECLFTKRNLVTASSKLGWMLRDKRKLFLSLKTFNSFRHYAYRQMQKIRTRQPESVQRRLVIETHGYDIKMAYHVLRLLDEMQQLLIEQDIDLMRNNSECKMMKSGLWGDFDRFDKEFQKRMDYVDELARKSTLPPEPQGASLRNLLKEIIEEFYGSDEKISKTQYEFVSTKDVMNELEKIKLDINYLKRMHPEDDGK